MPLELLFNPIIRPATALGVSVPLAEANFYASGSSTVRQNTYVDSGQVTPNANPVIADSNGVFPQIYLLPLAYHVVITGPGGVTTYYDEDPVAGPNYSALFDDSWMMKDNIDPTKGLKFQLSGIDTATTRTLTVPNNNGTLITTNNGIFGSTRVQLIQGADIVAANDLTLGTDGNLFYVTGSTSIKRISTATWQDGISTWLSFAGTPTIEDNVASGGGFAKVRLDGSANRAMIVDGLLNLVKVNGIWIENPRKS
jgi:hypothetical protein